MNNDFFPHKVVKYKHYTWWYGPSIRMPTMVNTPHEKPLIFQLSALVSLPTGKPSTRVRERVRVQWAQRGAGPEGEKPQKNHKEKASEELMKSNSEWSSSRGQITHFLTSLLRHPHHPSIATTNPSCWLATNNHNWLLFVSSQPQVLSLSAFCQTPHA